MTEYRYRVSLVVDGDVVSTGFSVHGMHRTLQLARELLGGIPQAECCVRECKNDRIAAYLHTNFRGELDEAEVYSPVSSLVVHMNPNGPLFRSEPRLLRDSENMGE